ncbi:MAG: DegT/DnrJ/EryC1/StrS family aminotransferase [Steroidobacteraceae bacterium]
MRTSSKTAVRTRDNFLVFGAPAIEDAEIREVVATMRSGWLGSGPRVAKFERAFAAYKNVGSAAAVNSCTAALHLALLALDLKPGDEVITSALTFCATVNTIIHAGATPVLADVDPGTMNLDPEDVRRKVTRRTRALLPVHFAGRACDMDALGAIADQHGLRMVEDCAHAIETEYHGKKAGTFGDFGCFSFYVTKNVATGEGGMLLARREQDLARAKVLGLHGMSKDAWNRFGDEGYKHYEVVAAGFKYNMMDLQAAIGIHQLQRVETCWQRRQEIWNRYTAAFGHLPVTLPAAPEPDSRHAYHLYTLLIDEKDAGISRDRFLEAMTRQNLGVGVHYLSIPEHPYYRRTFDWKPEDYPRAMRIGRQTVSLPLSAKLSDADLADVVSGVSLSLQPQ